MTGYSTRCFVLALARPLTVAAAISLGMAGGAAQAQTAFEPILVVTGEAQARVAPDLAQVRAGVTTQGKTAREASDANAKAMAAVVAALTEGGIAEKDLQTTRLSVQPVYDNTPNRPGPNRITAFQASNQVTIQIRDTRRVSDVVDAAIGAGANDLGGIEFVVSDRSKVLDGARAEAIADARRKAEIFAKAAGVTLGPVVAVAEDGAAEPPMPMMRMAARDQATPVSPGENTLQVGVTVTFQIMR